MNALVLIASGFEEIEAVTVIDVLRRGKISVTLATNEEESLLVKGKSEISILAEVKIADVYNKMKGGHASYDCVIVPGGIDSVKRLSSVPLSDQV